MVGHGKRGETRVSPSRRANRAAGRNPAPSRQAFNHLDKADAFAVDRTTSEISVGDYDAIMLPGGVANPDQLRLDEAAVNFLRQMFEAGKPVAVICHGPWTLVEADVVRNRTLTSWPSLRTDILSAGGNWVDREVQVCTSGPNVLVTSRKPMTSRRFARSDRGFLAVPSEWRRPGLTPPRPDGPPARRLLSMSRPKFVRRT